MHVLEVAEKKRISDYASTGMYYFSNGYDFIKYSKKMIASKKKVRGEYYVIPVYQQYIIDNRQIEISSVKKVWDLGTPSNLKMFNQNHASEIIDYYNI